MLAIRTFAREIPEILRSRRFVSQVLKDRGAIPTDELLLVASELVTNAVRHGDGEIEVRIMVDGAKVRLEVLDEGHAKVEAPAQAPAASELDGRGLLLVREISRCWGSGFDQDGRTLVWAELNVAR